MPPLPGVDAGAIAVRPSSGSLFSPIAIDRSAGRKAVRMIVDQGVRELEQGRWVVIFPEGTRVAPGQRKKYGVGGAVLAQRSGYSVFPIAHNAGDYWRRRDIRKYRGIIKVVIGPPIASKGRKPRQLNEEVEGWIRRAQMQIDDQRRAHF